MVKGYIINKKPSKQSKQTKQNNFQRILNPPPPKFTPPMYPFPIAHIPPKNEGILHFK